MTDKKPEDFPFPTTGKHDAKPDALQPVEQHPSEAAIDQGVAESFPASDPVSVSVTKVERKADGDDPVEDDRAGAS